MMRRKELAIWMVLLAATGSARPAVAAEEPPDLAGASWIWTADVEGISAPAGTRYFRTTFVLPPEWDLDSGVVSVTADNLFSLHVNGRAAVERMTEPNAWSRPYRVELGSGRLVPGTNCLAVAAVNTIPGAAGLIVKLTVRAGNAGEAAIVTDDGWRATDRETPGWTAVAFDDSAWRPVRVHGELGIAPWGHLGRAAPAAPAGLDLKGANWIWFPETNPASPPAATRGFRTTFVAPALGRGSRAEILATADNECTLFVNGRRAGQGMEWTEPARIDITHLLAAGTNTVAVEAANTADGPAGLIAAIRLARRGAPPTTRVTGAGWRCSDQLPSGWQKPGFDDSAWPAASVLGPYGIPPWGADLRIPSGTTAASVIERPESFEAAVHTGSVVFVLGRARFTGQNFIQNIHGSRAYFEFDTPSPAALGRRLCRLAPFRPGGAVTVLADAGEGWIGSPSVSYDGRTVHFTMAPAGDPWFHIYSVGLDGGPPRQITHGPFHDFDPVEMPDGRIAFASTRLGTAEEYHGVPAFCLFACAPTGGPAHALTHHIVGDREPRVTDDGMLAFIRCDNFLERAKVETHIHRTRLDGSGGLIVIGPDRPVIGLDRLNAAEENSRWLRQYGAGSPAPLPGGRIAAISEQGVVVSARQRGVPVGSYIPFDVSPLPDGRLLCSDRDGQRLAILDPRSGRAVEAVDLADCAIPPEGRPPAAGYQPSAAHSAVFAGARPPPRAMPPVAREADGSRPDATGFLYCQNIFNTRHTAADVARIRAVRVYEGRPFTLTPTDSIYMHIGTEGRELGTVPVAPDGSFYVEVPADRALSLQAVDAEGRVVIGELSWIYARPGERRSCAGCHADTDRVPPADARPAAAMRPMRLLGGADPHRFRANNAANGGVLNLQTDRFRECAAINQYRPPAGPGEPPPGRTEEILALLAEIESSESACRLSAANRLALFRNASAAPALAGLLKDVSDEVRCAATTALAGCGTRTSVEYLQPVLNDPNPVVAQAAHVALEHLTGLRVKFNPFTGDRARTAGRWMEVLDRLDWAAVERDLCARLARGDRLEAWAAAETLGRTGGPAGAAALRAFLASNPGAELRIAMAVMRSLGSLRDREAVPALVTMLSTNAPLVKDRGEANREFGGAQRAVYLAATAAEALGRIGGAEAERALVATLGALEPLEKYTLCCGDHPWLMGCHSSPVHHRILEALDALGSTNTGAAAAAIVRAVPMDKDRALLYELDAYEALSARVLARGGRAVDVVETCLAVLGDATARRSDDLAAAVGASPHAQGHIRQHTPRARAAQVLSVVAADPAVAPRIRALVAAELAKPAGEERSWVAFMLIRTLGRLRDAGSAELVRGVLADGPTEVSLGTNPPPHHWALKAMRPYHRAAAAWALGEMGDAASAPVLTAALANLDNAPAVREAAAIAFGRVATPSMAAELRALGDAHPELTVQRALWEAAASLAQSPSVPAADPAGAAHYGYAPLSN
jgi:HEAT repeat protein